MQQAESGKESCGNQEAPLRFQLSKESQLMIAKLQQLRLDDPTARGLVVIGDKGNQTAILLGEIEVPDEHLEKAPGSNSGAERAKGCLMISPNGLFLVQESGAFVGGAIEQNTAKHLQGNFTGASIVRKDRGGISVQLHKGENNYTDINARSLVCSSEQSAEILKLAIEKSRKVAQKPLREEIARMNAGNVMLDAMIQQENPPPPAGPTAPLVTLL